MTWVATPTFTSGNVLTAAQMNILADDLDETFPAKASAAGQIAVSTGVNAIAVRTPTRNTILTSETTASTAYTDLATIGPQLTVTTGVSALVFSSAKVSNSLALGNSYMGYQVAVSSSIVADDDSALGHAPSGASGWITATRAYLQQSLTAGSNAFLSKYRVNAGTGTFAGRQLIVIPL